MPKKAAELAALLERIVEEVERILGVSLNQKEVEERGRQSLRVFVHELLHAALSQTLPNISDPTDPQKDLAQEIIVRILEDSICEKLGLPTHTFDEHVDELARLFPGHPISTEDYKKLAKDLQSFHDLALFAHHVLLFLGKR